MVTTFEVLPDEILLLICEYLCQYEIIIAFFNLNFRLNCTISAYIRTLIVSEDYDKYIFELIRTEIQSLTVKNNKLTSNEIRMGLNIEELNLIRTNPVDFADFRCLTDLNMHFVPAFPSILSIYSRNPHLHSIYLEPNEPLTIPTFSPSKISTIKQLAIYVDSTNSFIRILRTCPNLTCLNLTLAQCDFKDSNFVISSDEKSENLSIFSVRFPYRYRVKLDDLKKLFDCLPTTLEYLSISIETKDQTCFHGQTWEATIKQTFPQLIRFEFMIHFPYKEFEDQEDREDPHFQLSDVLQTFQSSFWLTVVPQTVTGYFDHLIFCIHTEPIPLVPRRRYFLN